MVCWNSKRLKDFSSKSCGSPFCVWERIGSWDVTNVEHEGLVWWTWQTMSSSRSACFRLRCGLFRHPSQWWTTKWVGMRPDVWTLCDAKFFLQYAIVTLNSKVFHARRALPIKTVWKWYICLSVTWNVCCNECTLMSFRLQFFICQNTLGEKLKK